MSGSDQNDDSAAGRRLRAFLDQADRQRSRETVSGQPKHPTLGELRRHTTEPDTRIEAHLNQCTSCRTIVERFRNPKPPS